LVFLYTNTCQVISNKLNSSQHAFFKSQSTTTNFVTYLEFISPLVSSQSKIYSIYFDLNSTFDLVWHSILLHKLRAYGLSGGYEMWYNSYISNWQSYVRILDTSSLHSEIFSGDPQGSVLEHSLLNTLINDLYNVIKHS
jgi:hypothetical protein